MNAPASPLLDTVELTPAIGTEVRADIETLVGGRLAGEIRRLLEQRGVLVFRRLGMTDDQQNAFAATLGEVFVEGGSKTMNISLDSRDHGRASFLAEYLHGTFYWHIDRTDQDVPTLASLLTARRTSPVGGETEFANTYAAWDALSEAERKAYEGLRVVHSVEASQLFHTPEPSLETLENWRRYFKPKTHPLVWTHRSGRKSLVLGSTASHIEGMSFEQSRYLLAKLRAWATRPQFVYRHQWAVGDLLIWDNTGVMHRVQRYPEDSGRLMTRTTLVGEEPLV
jgi:alpha-ketoglutarate-dependent taurine dioxygenase